MDELSLFGPEAAAHAPVKVPDDAWGAEKPKWIRFGGSTKPSVCSHCIAVAQEAGIAPEPLRAVWRRKGPNGEVHLCHAHAQKQRELDDRAAGLAKARREINDRKPAGRRREGSS